MKNKPRSDEDRIVIYRGSRDAKKEICFRK